MAIVDIGKLSLVTHNKGFFVAWDSVIRFEWPRRDYSRFYRERDEVVRSRKQATGEE